MMRVQIKTANREPRQVNCLLDVCGIGRGEDNPVMLQGWDIAKEHATLRLLDGGVFVDVLNGRAPVLVNGTRIKDRHGPLADGDVLAIGAYRISVAPEARAMIPSVAEQASDARVVALLPDASHVPHKAAADETERRSALAVALEWRQRIHQALVRQMDLRRVDVRGMSDAELRTKTAAMIDEIVQREFAGQIPPALDRQRLAKDVLDEAIGLGPLEELLADESVTEVMVNSADEIWIERNGRIERSEIVFSSDKAVLSAIERIVAPIGRRIDESSPMVDARLADGSRVNAVIPPVALRGPSLSIRKFGKHRFSGEDLLRFGSLNEAMLEFLMVAVREKKNIVVTGGTGSGKTTLLNVLSSFIPDHERVVTIEDAAELRLSQPNLVALEARPANAEGRGQITIRDLVRNALRMRPDRVVVGECRGGEALDMLQVMNTGHEGSLTTAHANAPRDAISRLEVMVLMSGMDLPMQVVREQIASAVDLIVHQRRFPCGARKITHISEITGIESGVVQMQDLFQFRSRESGSGPVRGQFVATGAVPEFYEELAARGLPINLSLFRCEDAA